MVTLEKIYRELKSLQRKVDALNQPSSVKEPELSLDEALDEALEDVKNGRVSPAFSSGEELIDYLRSQK